MEKLETHIFFKTEGNGTSFHDCTIRTTPKLIKAVLGEPTYQDEFQEGKTQWSWNRQHNGTGIEFQIYDYKFSEPIDEDTIVNFHIGTTTRVRSQIITRILKSLITQIM